MSRLLLRKLDIDVLVQLALVGPDEAAEWVSIEEDPDTFGRLLWSSNYQAAAAPEDGPCPEYKFAPLPVTVTAIEGVKHCDYYKYQTAIEPEWEGAGVGATVSRLRDALLSAVPEYDDAPWGWSEGSLAQRAGRHKPNLPEPEEPDVAAEELIAEWAAVGLQLVRMDGLGTELEYLVTRTAGLGDLRRLSAAAYHRPPGRHGFIPLTVLTFTDELAARDTFNAWVLNSQTHRLRSDVHVYRWGNTVAHTQFHSPMDDEHIAAVDAKIAALATPDQHWWSLEPPLKQVMGRVEARYVRLSPLANALLLVHALYARNRDELETLSSLVADEDVRSKIDSIDTGRETALLLRGFSEVGEVVSGTVVEEIIHKLDEPELGHRVFLSTTGASMATATLLVIDRLDQTPAATTVLDPAVSLPMDAGKPRPLGPNESL